MDRINRLGRIAAGVQGGAIGGGLWMLLPEWSPWRRFGLFLLILVVIFSGRFMSWIERYREARDPEFRL